MCKRSLILLNSDSYLDVIVLVGDDALEGVEQVVFVREGGHDETHVGR